MKQTGTDRRSQRTRQLLNEALIALMQEQPYEKITVQDIIDRANVGRSTFYTHYLDKEDLLVSSFERMLDYLNAQLQQQPQAARQILPSLALFRHVQGHHYLYKTLVWGRGIELIFKNGQAHLSKVAEQNLRGLLGDNPASDVSITLAATFASGALLTLVKWWLENNTPHPPEYMDAMFRQLVTPGIESVLGIDLKRE